MAIIELPSALRALAENSARVSVEAETVGAAIEALCTRFPDLRERLWLETGTLKRNIGVFVGEDDVRSAEGLALPLERKAIITIVAAVSGG